MNLISLLFLGLSNCGKTSLIQTILHEDVKNIFPTHGFNLKSINKGKCCLNFWDISGKK